MTDGRSIVVKPGWLALASLAPALVVMAACGGPTPAGDTGASMQTNAGGVALTSDLVERPLPNPNPNGYSQLGAAPRGAGVGYDRGHRHRS